jgi:2,3-dihydroxybiphenyl 1,2-dioxygenase
MDLCGIGYIGFETPSIEAWRDYGPSVMGFGIGKNPENDLGSLYLRMDDRRWRLAFHEGEIDRVAYFGWEAVGRQAFEACKIRLKEDGVAYEDGDDALKTQRGVRDVIRFKDPAGFRHEIFYGHKTDPGSFVPGRVHTGFLTEARGFGHAVVMVPDFSKELEDFFLKTMGMSWYGWGAGKGRTGFFRTKLNSKTSHDIGIGHAPGRMGIQHIGLFVKSLRDVGETYDLVKGRQLEMQMTLGQHTQDPHLSFYHFGPSGFAVETITEFEPWPGDTRTEINPERLSVWGHELVGPIIGPSVRTPEELLKFD